MAAAATLVLPLTAVWACVRFPTLSVLEAGTHTVFAPGQRLTALVSAMSGAVELRLTGTVDVSVALATMDSRETTIAFTVPNVPSGSYVLTLLQADRPIARTPLSVVAPPPPVAAVPDSKLAAVANTRRAGSNAQFPLLAVTLSGAGVMCMVLRARRRS